MELELSLSKKILKKDILYIIMEFLETTDILRMGLVCKYIQEILKQDSTWRWIFLRDMKYFLLTPMEDKK